MKRLLFIASVCVPFAFVPFAVSFAHTDDEDEIPHPSLPRCIAGDPGLILPDLVAEPPANVRARLTEGERTVEFTTSIASVGPGALLVEGRTVATAKGMATVGYQRIDRRDGTQCARQAGVFEFHAAHRHFHFDDFVNYEVRSQDPDRGPIAATGQKASYCLIDIETMRGFDRPRHPLLRSHLTCNEPEGIQGISVGYRDVYDRTLPGQLVNLEQPSPIPGGAYFIINDVDPDGVLWEVSKANNRAASSFSVGGPIGGTISTPVVSPPPQAATPTPPPQMATATPRPRQTPRRPERPRPTRAPRPERPSRGTATPAGAATTTTATPTPTSTPTRTSPSGPAVSSCDNACADYKFSQMRLTWYDAASGGLNLSYFVQPGACEALTPQAGERASIQMTRWLTTQRQDTGRSHVATFTLGADGSGATSTGGTASISGYRGWQQVSYRATTPPIAGPQDGANFPVVFDLCLTVGDQAAKARMVCQEKNRGLLCHQG